MSVCAVNRINAAEMSEPITPKSSEPRKAKPFRFVEMITNSRITRKSQSFPSPSPPRSGGEGRGEVVLRGPGTKASTKRNHFAFQNLHSHSRLHNPHRASFFAHTFIIRNLRLQNRNPPMSIDVSRISPPLDTPFLGKKFPSFSASKITFS